jgi:hypothetical protein
MFNMQNETDRVDRLKEEQRLAVERAEREEQEAREREEYMKSMKQKMLQNWLNDRGFLQKD